MSRYAVVLFALAGCVNIETIDYDPEQTRWLEVPAVGSSYADCLELCGPPTLIDETRDGFDFHYISYAALKYRGEASYFYSKIAGAGGDAVITHLILSFDPAGSLLAFREDSQEVDGGWGAAFGHSQTPELYYDAERFRFRRPVGSENYREASEAPVSNDLTLEHTREDGPSGND